jgi:iron complex outermembrane receptor protein
VNAAQIETWGAELSSVWAPVRSLKLGASGGWTDAHIVSDLFASGVPLQGNRPVNSPEFTFDTSGDYNVPLRANLQMNFNVNARWMSSQYLDTSNIPATLQPSYWIANSSLGIGSLDDRWTVTAYVRNLTNSEYRLFSNPLASFGWLASSYGTPRTFGVRVACKY